MTIALCGCWGAAGGGEPVSDAPVVPVTSAPVTTAPAAAASPDNYRARRAETFSARWEAWTHAIFTLREDRFFLLLAVLIGVFSGLAVVCFRHGD